MRAEIKRQIGTKYATTPDGQIVKTTNGEIIPEDEPLFLLRAKDRLAVAALRYYLLLCRADGCTQYQIEGVQACISKYEVFKLDHLDRMKQPGVTEGR